MDGILLLCIGVVGAIASFLLSSVGDEEKQSTLLGGLLFYTIFVSIALIIIGLIMIILPENIIAFGLILAICGFLLMVFDIGMVGVMCGPHIPDKIGIIIFGICIMIIIYGLYLTGSGTLQYLGVI